MIGLAVAWCVVLGCGGRDSPIAPSSTGATILPSPGNGIQNIRLERIDRRQTGAGETCDIDVEITNISQRCILHLDLLFNGVRSGQLIAVMTPTSAEPVFQRLAPDQMMTVSGLVTWATGAEPLPVCREVASMTFSLSRDSSVETGAC